MRIRNADNNLIAPISIKRVLKLIKVYPVRGNIVGTCLSNGFLEGLVNVFLKWQFQA